MKRKIPVTAIAAAAAAAVLAAGCELCSSRTVTLYLPDFPRSNTGPELTVVSWELEYPGKLENGLPVFVTETVPASGFSGETCIIIKIARGINLPVLARPVFRVSEGSGGGGSFDAAGGFPAGAVYPVCAEGGKLKLNWEYGFVCRILRSCLLNSDAVSGFDAEGFAEAVREKAAEIESETNLHCGCWVIDPVPVISRLGYGLFRTSSLKEAETMSFSIPVGGGTYIPDNPFYPEITTAATLDVSVPINLRTAFIEPATGETVTVFFNEKIWCWRNSASGASESGRR